MIGPIVVWGSGAMGGTIGAHLVRAGHPVHFIDVVPEHVQAMRARGLRITGPLAEFEVNVEASVPGEVVGPLATVLLCVKAHHTAEALRMIAPHLAHDGVVVSVQNGLNEAIIAETLGAERTFGSFVNFGADYIGPGEIHYGGRGTVAVGEIDGGITPRARALHALFSSFDARAILTTNVLGFLWSKLAYASMLFATALSNEGIADALDRPEHRAVYAALAREVVQVARAEGMRLESFDGFDPAAYDAAATPDAAQVSIDALVAHNRRSAKTHSGIWRDLAVRKRRTEVDAQLGPVVSAGARHGVATPLNARLIDMVHEIERGEREHAAANVSALAEEVAA